MNISIPQDFSFPDSEGYKAASDFFTEWYGSFFRIPREMSSELAAWSAQTLDWKLGDLGMFVCGVSRWYLPKGQGINFEEFFDFWSNLERQELVLIRGAPVDAGAGVKLGDLHGWPDLLAEDTFTCVEFDLFPGGQKVVKGVYSMSNRFAECMLPAWPRPLMRRLDVAFARYQLAQDVPEFVVDSWRASVNEFVADRNACLEGVVSVDMALLDSSDTDSNGISVHEI